MALDIILGPDIVIYDPQWQEFQSPTYLLLQKVILDFRKDDYQLEAQDKFEEMNWTKGKITNKLHKCKCYFYMASLEN